MRAWLRSRCLHNSHRWYLPCFRTQNRDGFCQKHNRSCWWWCPNE